MFQGKNIKFSLISNEFKLSYLLQRKKYNIEIQKHECMKRESWAFSVKNVLQEVH